MKKNIMEKKTKRMIAVTLALVIILAAVFAVNGTFAAPNDIAVNLTSPNGYQEIEINTNFTPNVSGIRAATVNNADLASVSVSTGSITITGKKAGAATVAASSSVGFTLALNYQITDSRNISAYTVANGGEVTLSGAGKTKPSPVTVNPGAGTNNIQWKSLQTNIATVNQTTGAITGVAKGAAIIIGEFTDKWGVKQDIHILVGVGVSLSGTYLGELAEWINKGEAILGLNPNPYTPESLSALQTAVNNGKTVLDNANPTDQNIENAIAGIQNAIGGLETKLPEGVIKGNDGNYYKPLGRPKNVYEKVDQNGNPKQPPEYIYNPDSDPGNGNDKTAYPDGKGGYWVENPAGGNIYKQVNPDTGALIDSPAIWGGPNGKFDGGTGDDKEATKFGNDYWVSMGQNVWRKVTAPTALGDLTGGGPNENPAATPATPIYEHNGVYYVGPSALTATAIIITTAIK